MANQQLPSGQIQPVAQPVSTFVRPVERAVAGAAQPSAIPRVNGLEVIAQGSGGNVQGTNNLRELASALVPFNAALKDLASTGLELYASGEYRRGQNEATRAAVLANQQRLGSMAEYAAENRKLDAKDPIAAMAMDSINPYRRAGRENAIARVAATEASAALLNEYRTTPGLEQLDPRDPEIGAVKARATNALMQRYSLNPSSAGYIDYVAPAISQAWGNVTEQQWNDRQTFLKNTIPATATAEAAGIYSNALSASQVTIFDPVTGKPIAIKQGDSRYWPALLVQMQATLDRVVDESGLRGQATEMRMEVVKRLATVAKTNRDDRLMALVQRLAVGPPGKDGKRPLAGAAMFPELADLEIKYGDFAKKQATEKFSGAAALLLAAAGGDPAKRQAAMVQIQRQAEQQRIPADQALKVVAELGGTVDKLQGYFTDPSRAEQLLQEQEFNRFGSGWNGPYAMQEFEQEIAGLPASEKTRLRNQFGEMYRRKQAEQAASPGILVDKLINNQITANIREAYASNIKEASVQGKDIATFMQSGNANIAESTQRQYQAYQLFVRSALAAEAARLKLPKLPDPLAVKVATDALNDFEKANPAAFAKLFPGVGKEQSVRGAAAVKPAQGKPQSGGQQPAAGGGQQKKQPPRPQLIDASQLDQADQNAVRQMLPVLTLQSTHREIHNLITGGRPPASLKRAAREAGVSPGEFLIRQADYYKGGLDIPPAVRTKLLRDGRQAKAMGDYLQGLPREAPANSLMAQGQNWLISILNSVLTPPAAAAEFPTGSWRGPAMASASYGGGGNLAALVSSGEGGWNSVNYGTTRSAGTMRLTSMTIGQVEQLQGRQKVFAVGAYQFTPGVLARARAAAGLSPNAPMSPANQTAMFWGLILNTNKRPALRDYLNGRSSNLDAAHRDLALEWAGVKGPDGRGAYDGDKAGNMASIDHRRIRQALIQARQSMSRRS
jgi:hypothetical protein